MAQFVSIVSILHQYEVVSAVCYLMLIMLTRLSMQTLVRLVLIYVAQSYHNTYYYMLLIVDFGADFRDPPVPTPHSSGSTTAGETGLSLMCSTLLVAPVPLPSDVPTPTFQWFFGPNGNGSLPSGVTPSTTTSTMSSNPYGINYTSTLQFPRLSQRLHTGMYTCRIGAGRLASNAMVTVNGRIIKCNAFLHS